MKYLKYFEKIKGKNISVGRIYRSGPFHIGKGEGERMTIPLVKILEIKNNKLMVCKTYFKDNYEEHIFNYLRNIDLKNIASPEEIEFFNSIENMKKYNL